jgi:hypothetical protein
MHSSRREFAQEGKFLPANGGALGDCSREQLHGRGRAGTKVVDHVRRCTLVARNLVNDPSRDRLAELAVPTGEGLRYAPGASLSTATKRRRDFAPAVAVTSN